MSERKNEEVEILDEYDFSNAVIGKYAKQYAEGTNIVVFEPDVAKVFPDSAAVNKALRSLIEVAKKSIPSQPTPSRTEKPAPARLRTTQNTTKGHRSR